MAQVYKTIFQVRRATALEWVQVNPILRLAEPGFEVDTYKLKIGDGRTVWNDLPYIAGGDPTPSEVSGIVNASTHYDFPSVGNENYIYKAVAEFLFQWGHIHQQKQCLSTCLERFSTTLDLYPIFFGCGVLNMEQNTIFFALQRGLNTCLQIIQ